MNACIMCGKTAVGKLLDFGKQPVSSHYLQDPNAQEYTRNVSLGQCRRCGLLQLYGRLPWNRLVPIHEWTVRYAEPEEHLDALVETITGLPGISKHSKIVGVSFKDRSMVDRFKRKGFIDATVLTRHDLGIDQSFFGVETVQHHLTPRVGRTIVRQRGRQNAVIMRHILEHAYDPHAILAFVKTLLRPDGYVVIEVPSVDTALTSLDYSMLWEEHTMYITARTFPRMCSSLGVDLQYTNEVSYLLENSLVGIGRMNDHPTQVLLGKTAMKKELARAKHFARAFAGQKKNVHALLKRHGHAVLFGAGHLGSVWVNIMGATSFIDCFVDEDTHKVGMFMPGSRLSIRDPDQIRESIDLCLMSANSKHTRLIREKNQKFFSRVKQIASIFPSVSL